MLVSEPFRVTTPLVTLAITVDGEAVTSLRFDATPRRPPSSELEVQISEELCEYALGERQTFTVPVAPDGTPFQLAVWQELRRIPYGEVRTYGAVAESVGQRDAARAVGQANHQNPIPIIIPCHRVVAAGGKLGGFGGGLDLKRRLLQLEESHTPLRFPLI